MEREAHEQIDRRVRCLLRVDQRKAARLIESRVAFSTAKENDAICQLTNAKKMAITDLHYGAWSSASCLVIRLKSGDQARTSNRQVCRS